MSAYKDLIYRRIKTLRQQYHLGNNCGRSIFDLIEKMDIDGQSPLLFRLPFKNHSLSGFVGYKHDRFSIFLNSNRTLGYEIFTAAHEIYHLIENAAMIKENTVVEEDEIRSGEASEKAADIFAAELLMPESDIVNEYRRFMKQSSLTKPDEAVVITLQQTYSVEYIAITKRLTELQIIDQETASALNGILLSDNELAKLTLKLGFENHLNEPAKSVLLPKVFMKSIEENYKTGNTSYDELEAIFGYCDLAPDHFGYEDELSETALAIMHRIRAKLGSDSIGQK